LPQNDKRGTTNGSALVVTPESLLAISLQQNDASAPRKRQKGGRQKGTTVKSSQAEHNIYQKACAEAAQDFQNALDEFAKMRKCHMKKGLLDQIIQDAKKRNHVTHLEILKATMRKQVVCKSLAPCHPGLVSPMEQIELTLVELCIQLGHARQPLKCKSFIPLVNLVLKGTLTEQEVIAFKARYSHGDKNAVLAKLGKGYYYGFLKWNEQKIVSKRGEKFAANQADWSTYDNFATMDDGVYNEMVAAGISQRLDEKVWMDMDGNIVESKEKGIWFAS
jgi:hypothetical protein